MSIQDIQNTPIIPIGRIQSQERVQSQERIQPQEPQNPAAPVGPQAGIPRRDEYVPEEKTERQAIGLYRIEPDADGTPRAVFDAPEDAPEPKTERCTADTGNVDREIEKLKAEKEKLQQQLRAADNPQEAAKLQQRLASLEGELAQKDNDTYRRQHTVFS